MSVCTWILLSLAPYACAAARPVCVGSTGRRDEPADVMKWRILRECQDQQTDRCGERAGHCDKNCRAAIRAADCIRTVGCGLNPKAQWRQQPGNEQTTNH